VKILESLRSGLESVRQAVENRDVLLQQQQAYQDQLQALYASRSWRLTAPLRAAGPLVHWLEQGNGGWLICSPMNHCRQVMHRVLVQLKRFLSTHPRLKSFAVQRLAAFPGLKARLMLIVANPPLIPTAANIKAPLQCSRRARKIYKALITARENRQKG